jgi:glucose/arabinose dehydrogenase
MKKCTTAQFDKFESSSQSNQKNFIAIIKYIRIKSLYSLILTIACLGSMLLQESLYAQPSVTTAGHSIETYASNLGPVASMFFAPDGRLFITRREGSLLVMKGRTLQQTPFLKVNADQSAERGLLGAAIDPNFESNGYMYVYFTEAGSLRNKLMRFKVSSNNPDVADQNSGVTMLDVGDSIQGYHNGGALHFGRDGMLYLGVGEGHVSQNSQNLGNLQGKILRLNVNAFPNIIPADNPYVGQQGRRAEIWANGFRNPFSFAVNRSNGVIYVNDVGQDATEEVNLLTKGSNYGWPNCEGACSDARFTNPIHSYTHSQNPGACAITGGMFYTGSMFSDLVGDYFFGDYCGGWIRRLRSNGSVSTFGNGMNPIDLDFASDGSIYALNAEGRIFRIFQAVASTPTPTPQPSPSPSPAASAPVVTITSPSSTQLYAAGDTISYSATATVNGNRLPDSAFSWTIVFHHDDHTHPFLGPINGVSSGTFAIPTRGEVSDNVWYRINVTVTANGQSRTIFTDVKPKKSSVQIQTAPVGLKVTVDGQPKTAPYSFIGVQGMVRDLGAESPQVLNGKTYEFTGWSHNRTKEHPFIVPSSNSLLTANFREVVALTPTPRPTTQPSETATPRPTVIATPTPTVVPTQTVGTPVVDNKYIQDLRNILKVLIEILKLYLERYSVTNSTPKMRQLNNSVLTKSVNNMFYNVDMSLRRVLKNPRNKKNPSLKNIGREMKLLRDAFARISSNNTPSRSNLSQLRVLVSKAGSNKKRFDRIAKNRLGSL